MKTSLLNIILFSQAQSRSSKPWRAAHHEKQAAKVKSDRQHAKIYEAALKTYRKEDDPTTILQWWTTPSYKDRILMRKLPESCGGCWVTNDRKREKTAEALLIDNTRYIQHSHNMPNGDGPQLENRNENQYWVFWPREAASKGIESGTKAMKGPWDGAFNLTSSYRRDSDVPRPYGDKNTALLEARYSYSEKNGWEETTSYEDYIDGLMAHKNPAGEPYVTWMVSNCEATRGASVRWQFVQRLIDSGLNIEGYGECFDNVLVDSPWSARGGTDWGLFSKYKFYFAFENSIHCNDYLSEKFWRNSLGQGLVPIVYGPHPDDVKAMAPKNSFIHVEDFKEPKELVDYLEYLDRNDTAYLEYHAWRAETPDFGDGKALHNTEMMFCGVCQQVKERKQLGFPKRIIKSVANWWWVNVHDSECTAGNVIPEWVTDIPTVTMNNSYDEMKQIQMDSEHKQHPKRKRRHAKTQQNKAKRSANSIEK